MNASVGLVSETSFRVPTPGLQDTFGHRAARRPVADQRRVAVLAGAPSEAGLVCPSLGVLDAVAPLAILDSVPAPGEKTERAQALLAEESALTSLHRVPVIRVERPTVPEGTVARLVVRSIDDQRRRHVNGEVPTAKDAPALDAPTDEVGAEEARLDEWWNALCGNDPDTVIAHLTHVLAEAGTAAAPVAVHGGVLDLAVLTPGAQVLPRNSVGLVGGELSIRMASRGHRAWLHRQVVAGLILAAARQAVAAAPGLTTVRIHALHAEHRGHHDDVSALAVVEASREELEQLDLDLEAETLVARLGDVLVWEIGGLHGTLQPVRLDEDPALTPLLARLCRTADRAPA